MGLTESFDVSYFLCLNIYEFVKDKISTTIFDGSECLFKVSLRSTSITEKRCLIDIRVTCETDESS